MPHHHLRNARLIAKLMDNQFSIFGIQFGLDIILGLIPGIGDIASLGFSLYIIWIATQFNLPTHKILAMIKNVTLDTLIGTVPLIGDISDIFLRSNLKNLQILETHLEYSNKKTG